MNTLVKLYRSRNPSFAGEDSEVLDMFAKQAPDLIEAYPDAKADWLKLEAERQAAINEAFPPTTSDKARSAVGNLVRGATDTIASTVTGIAALGKAAQDNTLGTTPPIEENLTYRIGQGIRDAGRAITPEQDPRLAGSFAYETVPQALGSAGAFVAGGVAAGGSKAAVAGLGAFAGAGSGYEDARQSGATESQAQLSALLNGVVGTSEAIPLGRILDRLNGISGNTLMPQLLNGFTNRLTRKFGEKAVEVTQNALSETFQEALQEAFQGTAGNLIARDIAQYDTERELLQGVGEQAGAGGVSGLVLSLLSSAIGRHSRGSVAPQEDAPRIAPEPTLPVEKRPDLANLSNYVGQPSESRQAELFALAKKDLDGGMSLLEQQAVDQLAPQDRNLFVIYRSELAQRPPEDLPPSNEASATIAPTEDVPNVDQLPPNEGTQALAPTAGQQPVTEGGIGEGGIGSEPIAAEPIQQNEPIDVGGQGLESQVQTGQAGEPGPLPADPVLKESLIPDPAIQGSAPILSNPVVESPLTTSPVVVSETPVGERQTPTVKDSLQVDPIVSPEPTETTGATTEYLRLSAIERQQVQTLADLKEVIDQRGSLATPEDLKLANEAEVNLRRDIENLREEIKRVGHPSTASAQELLDLAGIGFTETDVEGKQARLTQGKGGVGKKTAAAFTPVTSWEPIFQEVTAEKGSSASRKVAILEAPNGTYAAASAVNLPIRGKRMNLIQTPGGNKTAEEMELLGYKPVASIKLKRGAKRFWAVYSKVDGEALLAEAQGRITNDLRTAEAVEQDLADAAGVPSEIVSEEGDPEAAATEAAVDYGILREARDLASQPVFTEDEANIAFNLVADEVKAGKKLSRVAYEAAENEALEEVLLKLKVRLAETGEYETQEEISDAALDLLAQSIEDTYGRHTDRRAFVQLLQAQGYGAADRSPTQSQAQRVPGEAAARNEAPETRFRQLYYGRQSDTLGTGNTAFQRGLAAASALGWRVELYQRTASAAFDPFFQREGGAIQYANRSAVIALSMNSAMRPSAEDARTLMHELAHGMADTLFPVALKAQILQGIDRFTDAELGIENSPARTAGNPDERLAEFIAQQGVDQQVSTSVAQRIFAYLSELFLRSSFVVQRMLGMPISPALARDFVTLRMRRVLNGDSVLTFLGGPQMADMAKASVFQPASGDSWSGVNMVLNPATMQMEADPMLPETSAEALFNLKQSRTRYRDLDDRTLSPDRTNDDVVAETIAPNNEVMAMIEEMYRSLPNRDRFTLDEFVQQLLNQKLIKQDPREVIREFAEPAAKQLGREINTAMRASDVASDMARRRIQNSAYQIMEAITARLRAKVTDAEAELSGSRGSLQDRLYKNATRLSNLVNRRESTQDMLNEAKGVALGELARLKTDISRMVKGVIGIQGRAIANESAKGMGRLGQIIADLNGGTTDGAVLEQYRVEAEKFAKQLDTAAFQGRFAALLKNLAQRGISLKGSATDVLVTLRGLNDPMFADFTNDTVTDRSRLALLLTLADSPVADILVINASSAFEERKKISALLKLALSGQPQDVRTALEEAQKLPQLGVRLGRILAEIARVERQQRAIRDRLSRQNDLIEFAVVAGFPQLAISKAPLEKALGIETQTYWEPVSGAKIRPPTDMAKRNPELAGKLEKFTFKANRSAAEQAELQSIIQGVGRWLDSVPAAERNIGWNDIASIREKLIRADAMEKNESVKASMITRALGSKADQLDQTGQADARRAARRIRDIATWLFTWRSDWETQGAKWSSAEGEAIKALGFSGKQQRLFRDLFYHRVINFVERRGDLAATLGETQGFEDTIKAVRQWLMRDPETARRVTPAAWPKLEAYLRQTFEANRVAQKFNKEAGLKVEETYNTADGSKVYRVVLGDSRFEVPRSIKQGVFLLYEKMRGRGWVDFARMSKSEIEAGLDDGTLEAQLGQLMTPEIQQQFLGEMALNPGESLFNAPRIDSPYWRRASAAATAEAFESSDGSVLGFARRLFEIETQGQPADFREFAVETIDTIQGLFRRLHGVAQEREAARNANPAEIGQLMMNARVSNSFPAGFLEYRTFDTHSMRSAAQQAAFHGALGYEKAGWTANLQSADDYFRGLEDQLAQLEKRATELGGDYRKNLKKLAEVAGGPGYLSALENATKSRAMIGSAKSFIDAYISGEAGLNDAIRPLTELVNAGVAHVLQGPASALTDTISVFQPLLHSGPSWGSINYVAKTAKATANEFIRPYLQIVGIGGKWDADFQARKAQLGLIDTDTQVKAKQVMRAIIAETNNIPGFVSRNTIRLARILRAIPSLGIDAKLGQNQGYQTAKGFWGVFTQMGFALRTGAAYGTVKTYEDAVARAVQFYDNPARQQQFNDPAYRVKAEDVGYTDRLLGIKTGDNFFKHLTGKLEQYGTSIDGLAKDYLRRRSTDPQAPLITDDTFRRLVFLGANEITMDSSLANRAPIFVNDTSWRLAMPLLGWSVEQAASLGRNFREVGGAESKRALYKGLLGMAAILPVAFSYALLRDEYDEEILGKKADRKNVFETNGEPGAIALATADMLARVGTFGILGDVGTSLANFYGDLDNRGISLDNRVYFVNSLMGAGKAFARWAGQGFNGSYATTGRPAIQALGGSGYLQWLQIANNLFDADNAESRVTTRINAQNYLRAAGREAKLDVRTASGAASAPSKIKPAITDMALAAFANDAAGFQRAYREALNIARDMGSEDPEDTVKRSFQSSHPLRSVFRTVPSEAEFARMLSMMDRSGQRAVQESVRLFNYYGEQIGVSPTVGKVEKVKGGSRNLIGAGMRGLTPTSGMLQLR